MVLKSQVSVLFPFKQLLLKPKFSGVEKIKTIGSTYMAAAGLSVTPGQENNQVHRLWNLPSVFSVYVGAFQSNRM